MGDPRVFGVRWQVVRELGRGGQGIVFEVGDLPPEADRSAITLRLKAALRDSIDNLRWAQPDPEHFDKLVAVIATVVKRETAPRAALKELLPFDQAVDPVTARERMKNELAALKGVKHPALIEVIDVGPNQEWFVTPFFRRGSLAGRLAKRPILECLSKFRPLVEAVSRLHATGHVHRDIKPENVFVADDDSLVLGDCGLAIRIEGQQRLTETYQNAGSRDWMPGWAMGIRLDEVKPSFDVFSLGKVLWSMVSGRTKLQLWYHSENRFPQYDLRKLIGNTPEVALVCDILDATVVEHEDQCLANASSLLEQVDAALATLGRRYEFPTVDPKMRCRFCGSGTYQKASDGVSVAFGDGDQRRVYACSNCGHLEYFLWQRGTMPKGWLPESTPSKKTR